MSFQNRMQTIVVATDLKGQQEAALEYARKLAASYGSRIILAHGLDPIDFAAVDSVPAQLKRSMAEQARAALDAMTGELLREGIHSHSEVRQGNIVHMLLDVAAQHKAGLIVIGTEGKSGAGPFAVGAVAEALVRLAPCPVLAVAEDWNAGEFRPTPGGPVLLALEKNEAASDAFEVAHSLAELFGRTLFVLHARGPARVSAILNPAATTLEQLGVRPEGSVPVHLIIKDGSPSDAVAEAIELHRPSILVAGVKRNSESPGSHGTAFGLLARSRVPVLCVPPQPVAETVAEAIA